MMKRTAPSGEIMLIEYGNGFAEPTCYQTSDQQLWFFLLLSEYLRITKDYAFLNERVACYPVYAAVPFAGGIFRQDAVSFL